MEIVKLIGSDVLPDDQKLVLEIARVIRLGFLQQNAFVDEDAYSSYAKQFKLLDMVLEYDRLCRAALEKGANMGKLFNIEAREKIGRAKMADPNNFAPAYDEIFAQMKKEIEEVIAGGEEA